MAVGTVLIGRQRSEALRERDCAEDNLAVARQIVDEMYTQAAARLVDQKGMDVEQRDLLLKARDFMKSSHCRRVRTRQFASRQVGPVCGPVRSWLSSARQCQPRRPTLKRCSY